MSKNKVLVLKTDKTIRDNIREELQKSDYDLSINEVVDLGKEIETIDLDTTALVIGTLDDLPGKLSVIRDHSPYLPFVIIADESDEDQAIEAMQHGVTDYVLSHKLKRLNVVVKRELDRYRDLVVPKKRIQSVQGILWEANPENLEFTYISPQVESILGYTQEQWLNTPNFWQDHIHPDDRHRAVNYCHDKTSKGESHEFEYRMINTKGESVWIHDFANVITNNDSSTKLQGLMVDVSEKKSLEYQRDRAYQMANIGHWDLDIANENLFWSKTVKDLHEVSNDYTPTLDDAIDFYADGHKKRVTEALNRAVDQGETFDLELKIITAQDKDRWVRAIGEPEIINGQCVRVYGTTQDITEKKYYRELEQLERDILQKNADSEHQLGQLAKQFLLAIEDLHPKMRCCIMEVIQNKLHTFIAPSLPKAFTDEITGLPINENVGTCGTAAHLKEQVISKNIFEDPRWKNYRHLGEKYNFSACWTQPILNQQEEVVATFAVYYEEPIEPSSLEKNTIIRASHILRILFDSHARNQAEQQLAQSEQRFKSLVQDGTDLIAILDEEANYKYVAPTSESVLGIPAEDFVGTNALGYIHPDDQQRIQNILSGLEQEKRVRIGPFRFRDAKGNWRWIESTITNLLHNSAIEGFVANSRDVTEKIEREQELKDSLELYEYVTKATDDLIYDWDITEDHLEWSDQYYDAYNAHHKNHPPSVEQWYENIHPEDVKEVRTNLNKAINSVDETKWTQEYRLEKNNGEYAFIFEQGYIIRDRDGKAIRMIGTLQDITDRKQYEEKLEELSLVAAKTTDVIIMTDPQDRITWVNDAFEKLTGYSFDESMGENPGKLLQGPETRKQAKSRLGRAVREQKSVQETILNYTKDGQKYWLDITIDPIFDDDGECSGFIAIEKDVSHQIQREEKLRESLEEKETLLQEIHHRVKNNLAVVSGMMQLQAFEEKNERLRQQLFDSVSRIQTMGTIHELLYKTDSFSRIQFDQNIKKLVKNVTQTLEASSEISIDYELQPITLNINQAIPCSLIINEVITNIIKHAFRKDENHLLHISVTEAKQAVTIIVTDDGDPLPEGFNNNKSNETLGLQLIQTLAEQLEAQYEFTSLDDGTSFTLSFAKQNQTGIGNAYLK